MRAPLAAVALLAATAPSAGPVGGPGADPAPAGTAASPGARAPGAMVAVPGGRFRAAQRVGPGADTFVYVRVAPFLLDATEVTVSDYAACVRAGRCTPAGTSVRWEGISAGERARWSAACNADRADRADHPVNCVDWAQAEAFCAFAGKRLPTEAEWEWAARGDAAATRYPWGEDAPADRACWSGAGNGAGGARSETCPVATHPRGATPGGLQDLAGDVWEWTSSEDRVATDSRGRGGTPARVARGGGFADAAPERLTAGVRALDLPTARAADLGFRCARSR